MTALVAIAAVAVIALSASVIVVRRRNPRRRAARSRQPRLLLPFTGGALDPTVLDAAIRIARATDAVLVPAYLVVVPFKFAPDAPLTRQVTLAMPLLEAVEHAALRAGVAVDARIERGRTPIHALRRLWEVEHFERVVAPAPSAAGHGFTPKQVTWILENAPAETLILKPTAGESARQRAQSAA